MPTQQQSDEFDMFGCAARCLIALHNSRGGKLTKEDFIDKYAPKYWANTNQCGGLTTLQIIKLALEMGLAQSVEGTSHFDETRACIRNRSAHAILMVTNKWHETDGSLSTYHHCTIVSPTSLRNDDLLYLLDVDYIKGHATGLYLPETYIAAMIPFFLLFR